MKNLLLRGCRLKNISFIYALVIYTGHDTKIMKNLVPVKSKLSFLDKNVSKIVVFTLIL